MSDVLLGAFGIAGGLLCAIADIFLDLKGPTNVKSGPHNIIDSCWLSMSEWRFRLSILLAAIGVPMYWLRFLGMSHQLSRSNPGVAAVFLAFATIGASGGFFIHTFTCVFPITYKTLHKKGLSSDVIEGLLGKVFDAIKIPFIVMFLCLVVVTSIILIIAIIQGRLNVPFVFICLNPLSLMLLGWGFRKLNKQLFCDLPGIIMPSVGLAMIGLMVIFSSLH